MKLASLLAVFVSLALPLEGFAQAGGSGQAPTGVQSSEEVMSRNAMSQSELKRLTEQIDQWNRVDGSVGIKPRVAKARATTMLAVLNVPCAVSDAVYRGTAPTNTAQHIYEAACEDGMGYLLLLQGSQLMGASCMAGGDREESPLKCALPANADSKLMAGTVLSRNHIPCKVREVKWLGVSAANLEHVEVACEREGGYVLRSPRPGTSGKLEVVNCEAASQQGIACALSATAPVTSQKPAGSRPALSWFKEALVRNGVSCETKRARMIGRESIKRRYLVEFECADRPDGLVAFVPSADDAVNAFESMNCASAAARGIRCELSAKP